MSTDELLKAFQASDPTYALSDEALVEAFPDDRFWQRFGMEQSSKEALYLDSARGDSRRRSTRTGRRLPFRRGVVLSVAALALTGSTAVAVAALNSEVQAPKAVSKGSKTVITSGPAAYPASACASSDPTSLLLPTTAIPDMVQGTSAFAGGGQSLNPWGMSMGVATPASETSAATVTEHLFNSSAPATAIQNTDPYNSSNPHIVTTFDEGITGFANAGAKSTFFDRAASQQAPTDNVNGQVTSEQMSIQQNVARLPSPNVVITTGLTGTNVPGSVQVTIEDGSTVLGFGFSGGSSLTLNDVLPYVSSALNQVRATCGTADIMSPIVG